MVAQHEFLCDELTSKEERDMVDNVTMQHKFYTYQITLDLSRYPKMVFSPTNKGLDREYRFSENIVKW